MKKMFLMMMMVLALVFLAGCERLKAKGAKAYDRVIKESVFALCQGVSLESIRRNFNTREKSEAWEQFCQVTGSGPLVKSEKE